MQIYSCYTILQYCSMMGSSDSQWLPIRLSHHMELTFDERSTHTMEHDGRSVRCEASEVVTHRTHLTVVKQENWWCLALTEALLIRPRRALSVLPPVIQKLKGEDLSPEGGGGECEHSTRPDILFMQSVVSVTVAYVVGLSRCVLQEHTHLLACGLPSLQQHSTTSTPCISPAKLHRSLPAALLLSPSPLLTSLL